jgi:hypothetical protein
MNLARAARLHKVIFGRDFMDGTDLWWLDQHDLLCVVPAKDNMAVTADVRAQASAGEGITVGPRVHTVAMARAKPPRPNGGDRSRGHPRADHR